MIMLQTKEHQNKLYRKYVWSPKRQSDVRGLNSPHIHLGLVYPRLMRSEAVSLSLLRTNCLKYLSIIANKQHLVKWTEFIFLASSTIVLWPLLISSSEELSSTLASGAFLLYLMDYMLLHNLKTMSFIRSLSYSFKVWQCALWFLEKFQSRVKLPSVKTTLFKCVSKIIMNALLT